VCAAGQCEAGPLIADLGFPLSIHAEDGYVYFTDGAFGGQSGAVKRFAADNPQQVQQLAAGIEEPTGLAIDGDELYFLELRYQVDDAVWRTKKAGPPIEAELIADGIDAEKASGIYYGLAAGSDYVFWFDWDTLYRKGVSSNNVDEIYFPNSFADSLVVDGDWLYFHRGANVFRLPTLFQLTPEPEPQTIATLPDDHRSIWSFTHHGDYLYYGSNPTAGEGGVVRVAKDGSTSELIVTECDPVNDDIDDTSYVNAVTTDGNTLYYTTSGYYDRVYKIALIAGAEPELVAEGDSPGGIAVDDQFIYWTEYQDGMIMRQTK